MKRSRFTDSQIIAILKHAEAGTPVPELYREHGMNSACFSRSGFSITGPYCYQFLVFYDQRSGCAFCASRYSSSRFFSRSLSSPRCRSASVTERSPLWRCSSLYHRINLFTHLRASSNVRNPDEGH